MGLTQAEFAARIRMAENSVARMERNEMIVTPPMELLISYIAREAGVEGFGERPSYPCSHERKGLGRPEHVQAHAGKLQNVKKGSKRGST
jgi:transcriptional regulator with XRE-family HTH domain